ncbi:PepSY domain-containing protein [Paenibacillus sp. SYP-B3998]|uniref:PepSY domain-containing protein n=1 Tax=Paenibacillus sp. SYP-B3998 TaxID=2678564 RepID=A0A6G4A090_9BACL|nr:PepSY domain-containing protein [Paenibacillus sp. SYP-B3998]
MRRTLLKLHLIVSLFLGLFIVVICTTGSMLVVEDDIQKMTHPLLYQATPGDTPIHTIQQNAEQAYPGFNADRVDIPNEDGLYHVRVTKDVNGNTATHTVYVDPGTGKVLGPVGPERDAFFTKVVQLHRYLLVGDLLGKTKASLIGSVMGLGLIFILVTGAYLWWPGLKKFASGFRIIRKKGKLPLNQGLHKTIGIVTIPFLLVFAITGTALHVDKYVFGWFGVNTKAEIPAAWTKTKTKDKEPLSLDVIVQNAKEAFPQNQLIRVQLPVKPDQTYQLAMKDGFSLNGSNNVTVYEDPYSGQILGKTNPYAGITFYNALKKGLHYATWGGEPVKIFSVIMGLMPLFLMITGLVIWQLKVRVRRKKKKTPATTPAFPLKAQMPTVSASE